MRIKFLILFNGLFALGVQAQKFSSSPVSSFGIGLYGGYDHPQFSGTGNVTAPVCDSNKINFYNPASYAFIKTGQSLFSTGVSGVFTKMTDQGATTDLRQIGLNHFAYAVPFGQRFAIAFGLKPFTQTGYEIVNRDALGTDTVKYTFKGSGSTTQAFTGWSARIIDGKTHQLSLGAHVSYLFGTSTHMQLSQLSTDVAGGAQLLIYRLKSIYYDFGLNYQWNLRYNRSLQLGLTYSPSQNLTAFRTSGLYSASDINNENSYQQLSYLREKSNITFPSLMAFGAAYHYRPRVDSSFNNTRVFQLSFMGEFRQMRWNEYQANFTGETQQPYSDGMQMGFGIEFTPHFNYLERTAAIGYLSRIRYRAGFQYATLPYSYNQVQMTQTAVTAGLLLPIISQRSVSSLAIGVVAGKRAADDPNRFSENFLSVNFGITIAPGAYDRWFRKYKID